MTGLLFRRGMLEQPAWLPTRLPNLGLWLDARNTAPTRQFTLSITGSPTVGTFRGSSPATVIARASATGFAATDSMPAWRDLSSSDNNVSQTTASKQPTQEHDGTRWATRLDAVDDFLSLTGTGLSIAKGHAGMTIIVAAKAASLPVGASLGLYFQSVGTSAATRVAVGINSPASGSHLNVSARQLDADASAVLIEDTTPIVAGTPFIVTAVVDWLGNALHLYRDGAQVATNASAWSSGQNSSNTASQVGAIVHPTTNPFGGDMYGLLVYERVLPTDERLRAQRFLDRAHALGLGL